jgi:hypothetical protein
MTRLDRYDITITRNPKPELGAALRSRATVDRMFLENGRLSTGRSAF